MIGIVNYGSGNIQAIANIYNQLNIPTKIITNPVDLKTVDKLILPGVGAFDATMKQLLESGLKEELDELVLNQKKDILGICVGMQIMANSSEEGQLNGLGWIEGKVKKFDVSNFTQKPYLPHMGWNTVKPLNDHLIFQNMDENQGFYFVHSYYYECANQDNVLATSEYGNQFTSSVFRDNIYGMQFHPEKSHSNGIQLLENFAKL
ncbi:MAG: imidazole glycerol phosphate synthase subunit HisH [Crocinitomicaceae bacterium]